MWFPGDFTFLPATAQPSIVYILQQACLLLGFDSRYACKEQWFAKVFKNALWSNNIGRIQYGGLFRFTLHILLQFNKATWVYVCAAVALKMEAVDTVVLR